MLTYMSIQDVIKYWMSEGQLFQVFPRLLGSPVNRVLLASEAVNRLVTGPWEDGVNCSTRIRLSTERKSMSTSQIPQTSFLSEISSGEAIPLGKLAYFRERFRDRLYELVVSEFLKKERSKELTRADLARLIGRKPEQITRWLGAPGNWTLETVSDLLLAISKAELNFELVSLENRAVRNYVGPDWLRVSKAEVRTPQSSSSEIRKLPEPEPTFVFPLKKAS
jgi:hypothetical protein